MRSSWPSDHIASLDLSGRVFNALIRGGITRSDDLFDVLSTDPNRLFTLARFGVESYREVVSKLSEHGYKVPKRTSNLLATRSISKMYARLETLEGEIKRLKAQIAELESWDLRKHKE